MDKFTDEQAEEEFAKYAENVTEEDVSGVLEKEQAILDKVKGPLAKFAQNIKLLFSVVKDYAQGNYKEIPWTSIAAIIGSLLYIFSPIDLIPDFIPVVGLLDDAAVLGLCLNSIGKDLKKYEMWKQQSSNNNKKKNSQGKSTSAKNDAGNKYNQISYLNLLPGKKKAKRQGLEDFAQGAKLSFREVPDLASGFIKEKRDWTSFAHSLDELREEKGMSPAQLYKAAWIDSSIFDLVIRFCVEREIYDLHNVNALLLQDDQKTLAKEAA